MKKLISCLALLGLYGATFTVHAEETVSEKATVAGKDAKRAVVKGSNRVEEELCGKLTVDSKMTCLAKKSKNRVNETIDSGVDKSSELKNSVDSDGN